MKIGIIGSSGFIGNNLYLFLKEKTNHKIIKFSSYSKFKQKWSNKVLNEIKKKKPEIIINCSANQNLFSNKENLINLINTNISSNILFLDQAIKNKNFKSYISFGTKWELGDTRINRPLNFYAATKNANESFYRFYANKKSSIISLKVFDTYGQNDNRKKFLNDLLKSYKKNSVLNITAGKQYLDYVHINDLCLLIVKIIKDIKSKKLSGFKSYTVSSRKPIRLINLIKILNKRLIKKLNIKIGKRKYRMNESLNLTNKIFNYPGWRASHNLIIELQKLFDKKVK